MCYAPDIAARMRPPRNITIRQPVPLETVSPNYFPPDKEPGITIVSVHKKIIELSDYGSQALSFHYLSDARNTPTIIRKNQARRCTYRVCVVIRLQQFITGMVTHIHRGPGHQHVLKVTSCCYAPPITTGLKVDDLKPKFN